MKEFAPEMQASSDTSTLLPRYADARKHRQKMTK